MTASWFAPSPAAPTVEIPAVTAEIPRVLDQPRRVVRRPAGAGPAVPAIPIDLHWTALDLLVLPLALYLAAGSPPGRRRRTRRDGRRRGAWMRTPATRTTGGTTR